MNTYNVNKKRDGQLFKHDYQIFALDFAAAKKQFASDMTKDNYEKSNDINWLSAEVDGVPVDGFYDLNASIIVGNDESNDYKNSDMYLHCSQESIDEGFEKWNEDVHTWEILDN